MICIDVNKLTPVFSVFFKYLHILGCMGESRLFDINGLIICCVILGENHILVT